MLGLFALSMWLVFLPLADLFLSFFCPVIGPMTMHLVVLPFAFLDVSICPLELSLTVAVVVLPGASLLAPFP